MIKSGFYFFGMLSLSSATNYSLLLDYLNGLPEQDSSLRIAIVEAGTTSFLPVAFTTASYTEEDSSSNFFGKTFFNWHLSTGTGRTNHSAGSANRALGLAGIAPAPLTVDCYNANTFISEFANRTFPQFPSDVESHAYIGNLDSSSASDISAAESVFLSYDYHIAANDILSAVGLNNDGNAPRATPASNQPWLMCSSYNAVSVGVLDGTHSEGGTKSFLTGPGRTKPEIVINETSTSGATATAAGCFSLLKQVATSTSLNANATKTETLQATVFAGCQKVNIPNWSRSETQPIDAHWGFGEVNLLHSHRILTADQQAPGVVERRGWYTANINNANELVFEVTLPNGYDGALASIATKHIRNIRSFGNNSLQDSLPPDCYLELRDSNGSVLQRSDSLVDNVEHLYLELEADQTYQIVLGTNDTQLGRFSIAWRFPLFNAESLTPNINGEITASNLEVGMEYELQQSTDLATWIPLEEITATSESYTWVNQSTENVFYRLISFYP